MAALRASARAFGSSMSLAASSSTCLTYCWVRVDPPWTSSPDWLLMNARSVPRMSIPPWS